MKKRILSLFLAILMVVSMLLVPTQANVTETDTESKSVVGKYVKVTTFSFGEARENPNYSGNIVTSDQYPELLVITDVAVIGSTTYYQLSAADGHTWPANSNAKDGYWLDSTKVEIIEDEKPTDPETSDVLDKITVEGAPEGAVVEAQDFSDASDGNPNIGIYNIKVKDTNGNYWQPNPGETVKITLPASTDVEIVTILHLLEDPEIIKYALDAGIAYKFDVSNAVSFENYFIMEDAVKAYQKAFNSSDKYIVFECFEDVGVKNGTATVAANGFSVFVSVPPNNIETTTPTFPTIFGTNNYLVRPDEWIEVSAFVFDGEISVRNGAEYIDIVRGSDIGSWSTESMYFHVKPEIDTSTTKGFTISAGGLHLRKIEFTIVPDFDYGNVYIGVVGPNTAYPNEIATQANTAVDLYYYDEKLNTAKSTYCMNPDVLINLNAIKNSDLTVMHDTKTVYGVADTTGGSTSAFLRTEVSDANRDKGMKPFFEIANDILSAYFNGNAEQMANYRIVPYVVKHETIGDNTGWYINCKIELKDTYLLQYDYNFPEGFDVFDIISGEKPNDRTVTTTINVNGVVTTTVDTSTMMQVSQTLIHPETNQSQKVTAEQVGWAERPDVAYTDTNNILQAGDAVEMSGNKTLYAVWKITSNNWTFTKFSWRINNDVLNQQNNPVVNNKTFTFNITTTGTTEFPTEYALYNSLGQEVGAYSFSSNNQFNLQDGQYIVIKNVPVGGTYTVTQIQTPDGYSCRANSITPNTDGTTTTGNLLTTFLNIQLEYNITYDLDDGVLEDGSTNPATYTVEDAVILSNPTKEGYIFTGWTGTGLTQAAVTVMISEGSTGDRSYTATWKPALADLTIQVSGNWGADQSYIFVVTNSTDKVVARAVIPAGIASVTIKALPVDTYKVTPVDNWAWRLDYTVDNNGQVELGGSKTVEFKWTFAGNLIYWLNGYSYNKKGG